MQPENPNQPSTAQPPAVPESQNTVPQAPQQTYQPAPQPMPLSQSAAPQPAQFGYASQQPAASSIPQPVAGQMPPYNAPAVAPGGFKQTAKKIYIILVSIFLVFVGLDGLYANAKYNSWGIFITPFNLILGALGIGLFYTYIIKKQATANKSTSHKIIMIVGNALLLLVAVFMLIGSFAPNNTDSNSSGKGKGSSSVASTTFTDPTYGFKIAPPAGWAQQSPPAPNLVYFQTASPDNASYSPNIELVRDAVQETDVNQLGANIEAGYAKQITNFKNLGTTQETLAGVPAVLLNFSGSIQGHDTTSYNLILIKTGIAYSITGWADSANWSNYSDAIKASMLSFQP